MRTAATENPLGVFRTVSLELEFSYGEILIVVWDGWRVRLPRRGELELEDDIRSIKLPRRNLRHVFEGYVVQFDSHS